MAHEANPRLNTRRVRRAIRRLRNLDLKSVSISEIEQHLTPLLEGYIVTAPRFDAGLNIYRGRKCPKPCSLRDISYPPAELISCLGRANDFGQSIFYGATARGVPLFELGAKAGDHIALSKWRTIGQMLLNHVGFSSKPKSFRAAKRKLDSVYKFVESTRDAGDFNALVYDYLAYNFARAPQNKDETVYKLTNAICRKLFSSEFFDGLLYPTIEMSGNADNVAIKPEAADRLLRLVSVEYIYVTAVRKMEFDIEVIDSATSADLVGTLDWSGRRLHWNLRDKGERLTLAREGGEWVAYDEAGSRVDPE